MNVGLVDVSIRDGNQSLWGATGLRTAHILQVAPILERVGFRALDYTSSTAMGVAVRNHREDPWERIRLTRALMPTTKLQLIGKIIVAGNSREEAVARLAAALAMLAIEGVETTAGLHRWVASDPRFAAGGVDTSFFDGYGAVDKLADG